MAQNNKWHLLGAFTTYASLCRDRAFNSENLNARVSGYFEASGQESHSKPLPIDINSRNTPSQPFPSSQTGIGNITTRQLAPSASKITTDIAFLEQKHHSLVIDSKQTPLQNTVGISLRNEQVAIKTGLQAADYDTSEIVKPTKRVLIDLSSSNVCGGQTSLEGHRSPFLQADTVAGSLADHRRSLPVCLGGSVHDSGISFPDCSKIIDQSILQYCVEEKSFAESRPEFKESYEKFSKKSGEFFKRYHLQKLVLAHKDQIDLIRENSREAPERRQEQLNTVFQKIVEKYHNETADLSTAKAVSPDEVRHEMIRLDCTGWFPKDFFKLLDDYFDG
jgi:hypothetical protein